VIIRPPKALLAAEIAAHQGDLGAILLPRHLTLDARDEPVRTVRIFPLTPHSALP
jgi:hypothetical protein